MSAATRPEHRPLFRRLLHTPLRDVVRGRLTGRLDLRATLARHELPAPAEDLVRAVVRRARLRRLERIDVAEELAAHFRDALAAGAGADAAVRAFGDPKRAAALIRRAKRRGRGPVSRALSWTGRAAAVGLIAYLVAGAYYLAGRPAPRTDYIGLLNAPIVAVPEADRAWPVYEAARIALGERDGPLHRFTRPPRPGEEGWPEVAAWLDERSDALALVRAGAARPALGFPLGPEPDAAEHRPLGLDADLVLGTSLTYLADLRRLARVTALAAHRSAEAGDGGAVLEDLRTLRGLAAHAREAPFLINDLVSASIAGIAVGTAGEILAQRPATFTDGQLGALAHQLGAVDELWRMRIDGERMIFDDLVQHLYTDDGAGGGRLTLDGLRRLEGVSGGARPGMEPRGWLLAALLPAVGAVMADRRELGEQYDRLAEAFEAERAVPLWERGRFRGAARTEQWDESLLSRIRFMPLHLLVPALEKVLVTPEIAAAERDAVQVAVALELHRRRTGAWPPTLAPLVPALLPAVPPDRFDGRPLRYALRDGAPRLYSVGADRDDDGGEPPRAGSGAVLPAAARRWQPPAEAAADPPADGDWILWPPWLEPLARLDD